MASFSLSIKMLLISIGVMSIAILLKLLYVNPPSICLSFYFQAPYIWSCIVSWLRPPYLYVVLNFIIIAIAASSCFPIIHNEQQEHQLAAIPVLRPNPIVVSVADPDAGQVGFEEDKVGGGFEDKRVVLLHDNNGHDKLEIKTNEVDGEEEEEKEYHVISRSTWVPPSPPPPRRINSSEKELLEAVVSRCPAHKPLVNSARFGPRKPLRAGLEVGGTAYRVSKSKEHDTLDNTWKAIMDGRGMPLTRPLKKSESFWENHHDGQVNVSIYNSGVVDDGPFVVEKSKSFRYRTNYQIPHVSSSSSSPYLASRKLRKEPSLSLDELNRKVETFIKKFKEEMRLQSQQSDFESNIRR